MGSSFSTVILLLKGPVAVLKHLPGQALLSGSVTLGEKPHLSVPQDEGHRLENHRAIRLHGFEFWLNILAIFDLGQVTSPLGELPLSYLSSGDNSFTAFHDDQAK